MQENGSIKSENDPDPRCLAALTGPLHIAEATDLNLQWRREARTDMTIELKPEYQTVIDLAIQSGAFRTSDEVIETALSMLSEDIQDGAISESRDAEPRFTLEEIEAELRALGKLN
jgi:Arc/MetJ-type ribon-helix-helix transcriptional regulator